MMSFKRAPRGEGLDQRPYQDVAPISPDVAKYARGSSVSPRDRAHQEAMERAKKVDGKDVEKALSTDQVQAKYKIEVFFGPKRTARGPNVVKVTFFTSGMKLHGGGDDLMFICRNPENEAEGCGAFISSDSIRGGVAICPGCQKAIKASNLSEYLIANFSTRRLAQELVKFFHKLGSQADVYCKYDVTDIRYQVMVQKLGAQKAHELRGKYIYPLRRILQDTAGGASLENRFFAFLSS